MVVMDEWMVGGYFRGFDGVEEVEVDGGGGT